MLDQSHPQFIQKYSYSASVTARIIHNFLETRTFPDKIYSGQIEAIRNLFLLSLTVFTEYPPQDPLGSSRAYALISQLIRIFSGEHVTKEVVIGKICLFAGIIQAILNKIDPKNDEMLIQLETMLFYFFKRCEEDRYDEFMRRHTSGRI